EEGGAGGAGRGARPGAAQPLPAADHTAPGVPPVCAASARGTPPARSAAPPAPANRSWDTGPCFGSTANTGTALATPGTRWPPVPAAPVLGAIAQSRLPR